MAANQLIALALPYSRPSEIDDDVGRLIHALRTSWSAMMPANQHRWTSSACLDELRQGLKFNICRLESSYLPNCRIPDLTERVATFIPEPLAYACCCWALHISKEHITADLMRQMQELFGAKFLFWLEVMSLLDTVDIAIASISLLQQQIKVSAK
jgi:hypothetical protein